MLRQGALEAAHRTATWLREQSTMTDSSSGNAGARLSGLCAYANLLGSEVATLQDAALREHTDREVRKLLDELKAEEAAEGNLR